MPDGVVEPDHRSPGGRAARRTLGQREVELRFATDIERQQLGWHVGADRARAQQPCHLGHVAPRAQPPAWRAAPVDGRFAQLEPADTPRVEIDPQPLAGPARATDGLGHPGPAIGGPKARRPDSQVAAFCGKCHGTSRGDTAEHAHRSRAERQRVDAPPPARGGVIARELQQLRKLDRIDRREQAQRRVELAVAGVGRGQLGRYRNTSLARAREHEILAADSPARRVALRDESTLRCEALGTAARCRAEQQRPASRVAAHRSLQSFEHRCAVCISPERVAQIGTKHPRGPHRGCSTRQAKPGQIATEIDARGQRREPLRRTAQQPRRRQRARLELRCAAHRIEIPAQHHAAIRQIRRDDAQVRRNESPPSHLALELHAGIEAIDRSAGRSRSQLTGRKPEIGLTHHAVAKPQQQPRVDLARRKPAEWQVEFAQRAQLDGARLHGGAAGQRARRCDRIGSDAPQVYGDEQQPTESLRKHRGTTGPQAVGAALERQPRNPQHCRLAGRGCRRPAQRRRFELEPYRRHRSSQRGE